jgi:hypothetical protein
MNKSIIMNKSIKRTALISVAFLSFFISAHSFAQESATDIVRKMDDYAHGTSCKQTNKIEIIRPDWKSEMTIKLWTKEGTKYAMMLIKEPLRDKGVSYLKRSSEAWNWQPAIERTIKLPPSTMMQSWMGSDVTNDDMIKLSSIVVDYTHKIIKDTVIDNNNCWLIEAMPKEDASVVWGKVLIYIAKSNYINLVSKYFDEDGILVRSIYNHDMKKFGNKLYPSWSEVIPANKKGQKTISRVLSIEWDIKIDNNFFSISNLKNIE